MLNKTGEGKEVIMWKQAVRWLESPLPTQPEQAVGEEKRGPYHAGPSSEHSPPYSAQGLGWYTFFLLTLCQQFQE